MYTYMRSHHAPKKCHNAHHTSIRILAHMVTRYGTYLGPRCSRWVLCMKHIDTSSLWGPSLPRSSCACNNRRSGKSSPALPSLLLATLPLPDQRGPNTYIVHIYTILVRGTLENGESSWKYPGYPVWLFRNS